MIAVELKRNPGNAFPWVSLGKYDEGRDYAEIEGAVFTAMHSNDGFVIVDRIKLPNYSVANRLTI